MHCITEPPGMDATRRQLEAWDREHVWHPFTQMQDYAASRPLIIDHADGCFLIDLDGHSYIDGVSSLWCNIHGHRKAELDAAIRDQLERVAHSTLLGVSNVPAIKLARRLVELAPPGLTRVFFSDDGATAVEVAIKMAFQYWQQREDPRPRKTQFVSFTGGYHGDTLGDVSVGGVDLYHRMFGPLLFPTYKVSAPYCYRCPLGLQRATCMVDCLGDLQRVLETHHEEIAAVVIEPLVQGAAGMITAPAGFLKAVREITRRFDVLLIADEVAVGFGRTGRMFACQHEAVTPDFLCLAKGLTGGYLPLAATLTTDEIYRAFLGTQADRRTFFHGHTYCGNPLGAAVALATLDVFESERVLDNLAPKIGRLSAWLHQIAALDHVGDTRQCGLIAGVELVGDRSTKEPYDSADQIGARVCLRARSEGLLIRPLGNVIVLMPPLSIDLDLLDHMCDITLRAIAEITTGANASRDARSVSHASAVHR